MTGPSAHGSGCLCMSVGVTYKREVWSVLAQQSGEDSLSLDTLFVLKHISIHEAVQHGRVGMDINVELQTNPLQVRSRTQKEKRGFFKEQGVWARPPSGSGVFNKWSLWEQRWTCMTSWRRCREKTVTHMEASQNATDKAESKATEKSEERQPTTCAIAESGF